MGPRGVNASRYPVDNHGEVSVLLLALDKVLRHTLNHSGTFACSQVASSLQQYGATALQLAASRAADPSSAPSSSPADPFRPSVRNAPLPAASASAVGPSGHSDSLLDVRTATAQDLAREAVAALERAVR